MRNHIIFFSGGKASFTVAHLVKEQYPDDNILLYFTDTLWEDEDLYRFIFEASNKLQLPMLIHSKGVTPPQLMVQQKFMANSRVGTCSKELKMKVASDYLKKGIVPPIERWHNKQLLKQEDVVSHAVLYFGIGWQEAHREEPIRKNWMPFRVRMPLIDEVIDNDEILSLYKIRQPRLYDMQFSHNNCKGRCIKAGQGHFKNLLIKDEKTYIELMEQEVVISEYIRYCKQPAIQSGKMPDHLIKDVWEYVSEGKKSAKITTILNSAEYLRSNRRQFGVDSKGQPIRKPYTFMKQKSLQDLEKEPVQIDIWDIGGCGCFVDYEGSN